MEKPEVTVLMPVYNGAADLGRAIKSVLEQSHPNFELLIVDDASTDSSLEIIKSFAGPRVRYLHNEKNRGLTESLKIGVIAAAGKYVARMDQDDVCGDKDRFLKQAQWLDQHPDCVVVGTYFTVHTQGQDPKPITPPTDDAAIRRAFLLSATLAHPTVMFRKDAYERAGGYSTRHGHHVEDIDLWFRMGLIGTFHILPIFGLQYYKSTGGISRRHETRQALNTLRVALGYLPHWRRYPSLSKAVWKYARRYALLVASSLINSLRNGRFAGGSARDVT